MHNVTQTQTVSPFPTGHTTIKRTFSKRPAWPQETGHAEEGVCVCVCVCVMIAYCSSKRTFDHVLVLPRPSPEQGLTLHKNLENTLCRTVIALLSMKVMRDTPQPEGSSHTRG